MSPARPNARTASGATRAAALSLCFFVVSAAAPTRAENPEVADLAWIAGHWVGEAFGGQIEESWFEPARESMSGQFRLVSDGAGAMYELLLIEQDEDGDIFYRFKHISPGWKPQEAQPLEYRLTGLEDRKATFRSTAAEPPAGAPAWFTYERPSEDQLVVSIFGDAGSTAPSVVLSMTRR